VVEQHGDGDLRVVGGAKDTNHASVSYGLFGMSAHGPVAPLGVASVSTPVAPLEPVLPARAARNRDLRRAGLPGDEDAGELRRDAVPSL